MTYLKEYVDDVLTPIVDAITPETRLFWSTWGQRHQGKTRTPMAGKNIWRLCKT